MTKQDYLQMLRDSTKQGAVVVKKDGTTRPLTDFERGIAMGRYKEICERAEFLNKKSEVVEPRQGYKNVKGKSKTSRYADEFYEKLKDGLETI